MEKKCTLLNALKRFDFFGVRFNFYYKSKEKFHSATGGIIFICFALIVVITIIIRLVPFINRKSMSIIYYTSKLPTTEEISFKNYSSSFAFGLVCDSVQVTEEINKHFYFEVNYVKYRKNSPVTSKERKKIDFTHCSHNSFYNKLNETFNEFGLEEYFCLSEELIYPIKGLYNDKVFNYYEIILKSSIINNDTVDYSFLTLMTKSECKISVFFTDTAIEVKNFKNPNIPIINTKFIPLNPYETVKMDLYFKLSHFESFNSYFSDSSQISYFLGFSNFYKYSVFHGEKRFTDNSEDNGVFSKIYLRADSERDIIQRNYQKLTEFLVAVYSQFSQVFVILFILVSLMNSFYAQHSIMKEIFQFKETKSKAGMNQTVLKEHLQKMKFNTLAGIKLQTENPVKKIHQFNLEDIHANKNKRFSTKPQHLFEIFNQNLSQTKTTLASITEEKLNENSEENIVVLNKKIKSRLSTIKSDITPHHRLSSYYPKKKEFVQSAKFTFKPKKEVENEIIPFKYNIIELIFIFLFPCFEWKSLKRKNILLEKAKSKLFFQLDILTYLKNMQLLDLLNYVVFEKHENTIVRFLSKPSISFANRNDIYDQIHTVNNINSNEIDEFYSSVKYLFGKENKNSKEERLCHITMIELNELLKNSYDN